MFLEKAYGQVGQTALFHEIDRGGGFFIAAGFGGADFNEDDAAVVEGDQVEFTLRTAPVALHDAVAESPQIALGGAFGARAEPAAPPGLYGRICGHAIVRFSPTLTSSGSEDLFRRR